MSTYDDTAWQTDAACADIGLDTFFPNELKTQGRRAVESAQIRHAKQICAGCPVQTPCLEYALSSIHSRDYGVWGGTSPDDRAKLRRKTA